MDQGWASDPGKLPLGEPLAQTSTPALMITPSGKADVAERETGHGSTVQPRGQGARRSDLLRSVLANPFPTCFLCVMQVDLMKCGVQAS